MNELDSTESDSTDNRAGCNRAGHFKTNLSGELAYRSYVPAPLPPDSPIGYTDEMAALLSKANSELAILEAVAKRIPNVRLFVSMFVRKEALMSSQIEGTQATLEDVLDSSVDANRNRDVADVVNYVRATEFAIGRLAELPLCNRLIKETHAILMEGVRGEEKNPGEFRRSQNWIVGQGSTLKNARYIPPSPDDMTEAMSDLERYMNGDDAMDPLVRAALIHYQFESIHPFLDGNGRVGRLLITLYLMDKGVLSTPALYISYYLKANRVEYYDRMTAVRSKGGYEQWVEFFLRAVAESAGDAVAAIDELDDLHNKNVDAILRMGRASKSAGAVFGYLEANPIIDVRKTAEALGLTFNTVSSAVRRLVEAGILVQTSDAGRNRTFAYGEYLKILRRGTC